MVDELRSRSDVLKLIKSAEIEGVKKEESARARAVQIKSAAQTESARMIEEAEKNGRTAMRSSIEAVKIECAKVKEIQVTEAAKKSQINETESKARLPAVAELMFDKFKKEHNV